jgi:hypothetical protein
MAVPGSLKFDPSAWSDTEVELPIPNFRPPDETIPTFHPSHPSNGEVNLPISALHLPDERISSEFHLACMLHIPRTMRPDGEVDLPV